ncbi:MAG: ATP-binding cassette domain-containing protein [Oscillospiraceae bacterium]
MEIKIENLNKSYKEKIVIKDFSLTLKIDKTIAVMGESGCGKTTLLRLIAGIEKPDSGKITKHPTKISFMFQEDRLLPWLNAFENVKLVGSEDTAKKYLSLLGLENDFNTKPNELSGGMQRRVALARALNFSSDLIILDEPFKGIDESLKDKLIDVIKSEKRDIILVTHNKSDAKKLTDNILTFKGIPLELCNNEDKSQ